MMTLPRMLGLTLAALVALILLGPRADAAEIKTYISLGDSRAFGYTDPAHLVPSFGDQGYVQPYADFLASGNGGLRPHVINLAVPGETTDSFFTGGSVATILSGNDPGATTGPPAVDDRFLGRLVGLNRNYPDPTTSQHSLLLETIAAEQEAGRVISDVSISLGANDLFAMALSPGFLSLPPDQQQARLLQTLGTVQQNYTHLLTDLRAHLPQANLVLVGLYDPFPAAPSSPFAALAGPATAGLNQVLAAEAAAFGGHYVDTSTAFAGHEAEFTYIGEPDLTGFPNVHPNATGYAVIARQMEAVAVPEPSSLMVLSTGLVGLIVYGRRRRQAV